MHIVIANGPPFSGKDTFVSHLLKRFPTAIWMRFKNVLYQETWTDLFVNEDGSCEITLDKWIEICNDVVLKDKPLPYSLTKENIALWEENPGLYGNEIYSKTPRKHLIDKSEKEIKVEYGEAGVAIITAGYIKDIQDSKKKLVLFSDGGFNVEVGALKHELELDRCDLSVIRLVSEGCTFEGDSREYIDDPDVYMNNDKTEEFMTMIDEHIVPMIAEKILYSDIESIDNIVKNAYRDHGQYDRQFSQDRFFIMYNENGGFETFDFCEHGDNTAQFIIDMFKEKKGFNKCRWTNSGDVAVEIRYCDVWGVGYLTVKPEPSEDWKWRRIVPV